MSNAENNDQSHSGWLGIEKKWWAVIVVGTGSFMSAMTGNIVNIALPTIQKCTGAPMSTVEWVILAFIIVASSLLLVFGRLADIYGRRRLYMSGQIIFVLASTCCGLVSHIGLLIGFRIIQAVGAAMIFAVSPSIITKAFPGKQRGTAMGLQSTMTYLGSSLGPALGGILTQHFGWPSVFFVNLPIGLIAVFISMQVLEHDQPGERQSFDPIGAGTLALTLIAVLFALSKGPEYGWGNAWIISMLSAAVLFGVVFVWVEQRIAQPALDLRLFHNTMFTSATLAAFTCYATTASLNFIMPFYLMQACGLRADHAGLILMIQPVMTMIFAAPSGYISDKVGVRLPATIGMAITTVGVLLLHRLHPGMPTWQIMGTISLVGVGAGLFNTPNNSAIMGSAPANRQGVAGAVMAAARNLGMAGIAFTGMVYISCLKALHELPEPQAITGAMHTSATVIAVIAFTATILSALRGKNPIRLFMQ